MGSLDRLKMDHLPIADKRMGHPDSKNLICSTVQYNYTLNKFFSLPRIGSLDLRWVILPIADKRMGHPDSKDPRCFQYD